MNGSRSPRRIVDLTSQRGDQRGQPAAQVQQEHRDALRAEPPPAGLWRHQQADQQRVDRQPCRAGHQRRGDDGGDPVARRRQRPGRHDARDRAGERRQHRDEGAAFQPGLGHHPVHQERRPRHVADAFQEREQAEQQHDLRNELQHGPDAADDPLTEQPAQDGIADVIGDLAAQPGQRAADAVPQRGCGGEQDLEEVEHHREEDDRAPQRVQQHPVDSPGALDLVAAQRNRLHRAPIGPTRRSSSAVGRGQHRRALPLRERRQLRPQLRRFPIRGARRPRSPGCPAPSTAPRRRCGRRARPARRPWSAPAGTAGPAGAPGRSAGWIGAAWWRRRPAQSRRAASMPGYLPASRSVTTCSSGLIGSRL